MSLDLEFCVIFHFGYELCTFFHLIGSRKKEIDFFDSMDHRRIRVIGEGSLYNHRL